LSLKYAGDALDPPLEQFLIKLSLSLSFSLSLSLKLRKAAQQRWEKFRTESLNTTLWERGARRRRRSCTRKLRGSYIYTGE